MRRYHLVIGCHCSVCHEAHPPQKLLVRHLKKEPSSEAGLLDRHRDKCLKCPSSVEGGVNWARGVGHLGLEGSGVLNHYELASFENSAERVRPVLAVLAQACIVAEEPCTHTCAERLPQITRSTLPLDSCDRLAQALMHQGNMSAVFKSSKEAEKFRVEVLVCRISQLDDQGRSALS